MLRESDRALWDEYDTALLDLDGVVYIGPQVVPRVPERLEKAASAGMRLAYVTNNASRPPSVVAQHLRELGIPARTDDVVTSAQAAARLLSAMVEPGAVVFVIGGAGLDEALGELGFTPVRDLEAGAAAVVSGYNPDLPWRTVTDGAILVRNGLPWVASNTDMTVPTAHGPGLGNGVLVEAVARFAHRRPEVAGKPQPTLFEETVRRVGGKRPLVVGDRLDTDIEGARNAGYDSLLVLTGVTGITELVQAPPQHRPSYISADLGGLASAHPVPGRTAGRCALRGWTGEVRDGRLELSGDGEPDDWWRVAATLAWEHLDTTGSPVDVSGTRGPGSVTR
ncbi:MAG TPA: HAD-IIA family hydrolase [Nocardioidaceae bacterium]|jgi:HAD superfamily hydrolase (TIGR01450 family)